MKVRYSYLQQQFQHCDELWSDLKRVVDSGDFTLGCRLKDFEEQFADLIGVRCAIGVNSGTDAIKLSLKALGVGVGDEVVTAANTFVATVGAIVELGAIPVFVDCDESFCINPYQIEQAITEKTKAIVPVHLTGYVTDMPRVVAIANRFDLGIVEDACQAILGSFDGRKAGTWGDAGAFSLHPLKNLNVWADGGVIVTNNEKLAETFRLLRNHGLSDRDTVEIMGFNSRLDTIQAVVGSWLIPKIHDITRQRIENAAYYDQYLSAVPGIRIPKRISSSNIVYHLYIVFAEQRDQLLDYCLQQGIEAKVHYPVPIYRQPALRHLGHQEGSFPVTEEHSKTIITFPCDQHLTKAEMDYVILTVKNFYKLQG